MSEHPYVVVFERSEDDCWLLLSNDTNPEKYLAIMTFVTTFDAKYHIKQLLSKPVKLIGKVHLVRVTNWNLRVVKHLLNTKKPITGVVTLVNVKPSILNKSYSVEINVENLF